MHYESRDLLLGDLDGYLQGYRFSLALATTIENLNGHYNTFILRRDPFSGEVRLVFERAAITGHLAFSQFAQSQAGILSTPELSCIATSINHEELGRAQLTLSLEGPLVVLGGSSHLGKESYVEGAEVAVRCIGVDFQSTVDQKVHQHIEHLIGTSKNPGLFTWPRFVSHDDMDLPEGENVFVDFQPTPSANDQHFERAATKCAAHIDALKTLITYTSVVQWFEEERRRGQGLLIYAADEMGSLPTEHERQTIRQALSFLQLTPICLTSSVEFNKQGAPIRATIPGHYHYCHHGVSSYARLRYDVFPLPKGEQRTDVLSQYVRRWIDRSEELELDHLVRLSVISRVGPILEMRLERLWSILDRLSQQQPQPPLFSESQRETLRDSFLKCLQHFEDEEGLAGHADIATVQERIKSLYGPRRSMRDDKRIIQFLQSHLGSVSEDEIGVARQIRNELAHGDELTHRTPRVHQIVEVLEAELSRVVLMLLELPDLHYYDFGQYVSATQVPSCPPLLN